MKYMLIVLSLSGDGFKTKFEFYDSRQLCETAASYRVGRIEVLAATCKKI